MYKKGIIILLLISIFLPSIKVRADESLLQNAKSGLLMEVSTGKIIYEKNIHEKTSVASMTKMMGMVLIMEALEDGKIKLEDMVVVSKNASGMGGSQIWLEEGEKISVLDLIKGIMMASANDGIVAMAEYIGGTEANFVKMMNEKAKSLGLKDTNFVNPTGLDEKDHYSTAYDLMLIANYLLKIPYLANIVSKKSVEIEVNGYNKTVGTTNEMLSIYDGANGVKTGFTANAGRCIVTSVNRDSRKLISVVLGCDTKKNRTIYSLKLLNYGFESYKLYDFSKHIKQNLCISVEKSEGKLYMLSKNVTFVYPLKDDEIKDINVRYNIRANLVAPIYKGEKVATAGIYIGQNKIRRN